MAPRVGFEPTTLRLTAGCSAVELPRNFFGALRFLGARKYYRHFNFRRNPLFQKFFQQPIPGACLICKFSRTPWFRYRTQPDMYGSGEQGIRRKLFAESWLRMRVFQMVEGGFGWRMLPERRCASFITELYAFATTTKKDRCLTFGKLAFQDATAEKPS